MPFQLPVQFFRRLIGAVLAFLAASVLSFAQVPVITVPPVAQTVLAGQFVAFSVAASGTPAPSFQWKKSGIPLDPVPGQPDYAFVIISATEADAGAYSVTVSNSLGSVTSTPVALAVGAVRMNPLGSPSTSRYSVSSNQSLATRITIPAATKLAAVIGDIANGSGTLYVAVVPLASLTAVPVGGPTVETPFNAGEVTASTTFTLPSGFSGRVTVPLSADLAPGIYGVVFGTAYLGATGSGSILRHGSTTGSSGMIRNAPPGSSYAWANTSSQWSIGLATVTGSVAAPAIVVPPASAAVALGGKTTLSVVASGTAPLAYQWFKDGTPFDGATGSTLLLASFQTATAGDYSVVVSNFTGTATSASATLSVSAAPSPLVTLTTPYGGTNIVQGVAQSLAAVAVPEFGRSIVSVTFYANGVPIGSALSVAPYAVNWTPTTLGAHAITARAWDNAGVSTLSSAMVFNVIASALPTVAVTSPAHGASLFANTPLTVTASATATTPATIAQVQFFANGILIGTDTTFPFAATWTPTAPGNYSLTARATDNLATAADSAAVSVTVTLPLAFLSANAATFTTGFSNSFTVQTNGSPAPLFSIVVGTFPSWATLNATTGVISGTPTNTTGSPFTFTLQASNGVSSAVTQPFTLTVAPSATPPVIASISAPRQVVSLGQNLDLSVTATSGTPPTFQWKRNGFPIVGAIAATYSITGATPARDNGWYQAVVTNSSGSTTSAVVFVNVSVNPAQVAGFGNNTIGQAAHQFTLGGVIAVAAASNHSLALKSDGTVAGWGSNYSGETSIPSGLSGVVAVAAGGASFSLALKSDGTVVGWGNNYDSQAAPPSGLTGVVAIAAGYGHGLAVKSDGIVVVWGYNGSGQTSVPSGLNGIVAVAGGNSVSLALKSDGTVVAWGNNGSGQTTIPSGLSGVIALAAGSSHALALKSDGTVVGWGNNTFGQATLPSGVNSVVALATGDFHSLVLKSDGTAVGWGHNFHGQTTFSPGLANITAITSGAFHTLLVHNPAGDTAPPSISGPLSDQTAFLTGSITFPVTVAVNPAPPTYQWRKTGVPIPGATTATYLINNLQSSHAGAYDVVVTNGVGSVTSSLSNLTVVLPPLPTITSPPVGRTLNAGNVGSFTVTATSPAALTYQWRKDGGPLPGRFSASSIIGPVQLADAGTYDVVVTNVAGSVTSAPAILVVHPSTAPVFTLHPLGGLLNVGDLAHFTAAVTGAAPLAYQWRKDGAPIPGANGDALYLPNAQLADAGIYDLVATNALGSVPSAPATLLFTSMLTLPTVSQPPASQTALIGVTASFSIVATGVPAPTLQWRRNGVPLAGATAATYLIGLVQENDAGTYDVVVSNAKGSATSGPATLTVRGRPVIWTARLVLGAGDAVGTFTLEGTASKRLLVRAVGPTLASFGVIDPLADPKIEIFDTAGQLVAANDDWPAHADQPGLATATLTTGAFALNPGAKDSVVLRSFAPGTYVARVTPSTPGGRIVLLELYDAEPASATRVPYTAVRGSAASSGSEIVIGGLGANASSQRTYLLRASGPALGAVGTLANPTFTVLRDSVVRAGNDDWQTGSDTTGVAAAAARVGTFPFAPGSRDSALLVTAYVRSGLYVGQVAGAAGNAGLVLVEAIEADEARPTLFAPAMVSPPSSRLSPAGVNVTLETRATGTEPVTYQWRKDGVTLNGATSRSLALPNVVVANGGHYTVIATNAQGTATSPPAVLTVDPTAAVAAASQVVAAPSGYVAGTTVTITNTLTYPGAVTGLGWTVTLPPGWSYAGGGGGAEGDVKPAVGATGKLEWSWSVPPASPVSFSYALNVPAGETGFRSLLATALVRTATSVQTLMATPSPLVLVPLQLLHSADTNQNFALSLLELTRVIELYNTRIDTTRTGSYAVPTTIGSEDGFVTDALRAANATVTLGRYHSADTNRDGKIGLIELTRVIELYNTRAGTNRTGTYHVASATTEDGFEPGP